MVIPYITRNAFRKVKRNVRFDMAVGFVQDLMKNRTAKVMVKNLTLIKEFNTFLSEFNYCIAQNSLINNDLKLGDIVLMKRKEKTINRLETARFTEGMVEYYNEMNRWRKDFTPLKFVDVKCTFPIPVTPSWLYFPNCDKIPTDDEPIEFDVIKILEETADPISGEYKPPKLHELKKKDISEYSKNLEIDSF